MSNNLIDNIFDYNSYRYVPEELKVEWKNLYNLNRGDYFKKQHEIYSIYPQTRIDLYNEELDKLNHIENLYINFNCNLDKMQPKYNSDIEHSKQIKKSLEKSINKMNEFICNKKSILEEKFYKNNIPRNEIIIENFKNDKKEYDYIPIYITLIMIFLLFYLLF